ncbi:RNA polymerase sigma-I factor [Pradoshia eiseniae]|uniref:RNA polymerase sigma factor SigI n=2 Tax=Pradoshia eiseniae TaxID=2064768 RepID=A0A2S7MYY1_9BACI|nr:RNA polymerase sigma factor SigI [Pradoshia eiseniae]PQD95004.1 RNA polymerase sigma-I factor [Pradoshia eiseniae]
MLGVFFSALKKRQSMEDMVYSIQKGDFDLRNDLIEQYKPFIKRSVSSVCKRYITDTDDEFSIGLIAFNDAIDRFSYEKGTALLSFADTMIKRRVIDHLRVQSRKKQELSIDFSVATEDGYAQSLLEADRSIEFHKEEIDAERRRDEIKSFTGRLQSFGITFDQLVQASPKHADARKNAISIARIVAEDSSMLNYLFQKKKLPLKILESKVNVSRKTIERNRIYIVAMVLVLSGDYRFLSDYIKGVLKD